MLYLSTDFDVTSWSYDVGEFVNKNVSNSLLLSILHYPHYPHYMG